MKQLISRLKPYLRWVILGATLFFLGKVLKDNWQQVTTIRVESAGWGWLTIALVITLIAHAFAGWVWSLILRYLQHLVNWLWAIQTYLITNIAKYLPGNVWHFYGRAIAATKQGISLETATVSVLLEPLLMAASALLVALLSSHQIVARFGYWGLFAQCLGLLAVLLALHPKVLNPVTNLLHKLKQKAKGSGSERVPVRLENYPFTPLLGELGFLGLRATGFLLTFLAISPIEWTQIPLLVSVFSLSWLLGLVVPGAPGGIGVFEATAIALLGNTTSPGILFSIVALYRLISVLAEAIGAGLAWLSQKNH